MPAERSQLNIRMKPETWARLEELRASMHAILGFPVSQAAVVDAALIELQKRYPPATPPNGSQAGPKRKRKNPADSP